MSPTFVTRHLLTIYPQLKGTRVDYAWGGRLAITMRRLPFIRRLRPGVYVAAGYSGQGVALAPFAGKLIADAIGGDASRFDAFAALPCPPFPGGRMLRYPGSRRRHVLVRAPRPAVGRLPPPLRTSHGNTAALRPIGFQITL